MTLRTVWRFPFRHAKTDPEPIRYFPFLDENGDRVWRFPYWYDYTGGSGEEDMGIEDAPVDGKAYVRQDGAWVEHPIGLTHIDEYTFNGTLAAPPGAGQLRMDTADQPNATKLWIANATAPGVDIGAILRLAEPGWIVSIQDKDEASRKQSYFVSAVTSGAAHTEYTVSPRASLDLLVPQRVMILLWGTKTVF